MDNKCPVIGITGGVGAGKTLALNYLKQNYNSEIIVADDLANELKLKGNACYVPLVEILGENVLDSDGEIDKSAMSAKIFSDAGLLAKINSIIHPAVKTEILRRIEITRDTHSKDYIFLEAALLIECGYKPILDELWYICADSTIRVKRLQESRGYSMEKCNGIIMRQLSDEEYRDNADRIIYNNGNLQEYYNNLDLAIKQLEFC